MSDEEKISEVTIIIDTDGIRKTIHIPCGRNFTIGSEIDDSLLVFSSKYAEKNIRSLIFTVEPIKTDGGFYTEKIEELPEYYYWQYGVRFPHNDEVVTYFRMYEAISRKMVEVYNEEKPESYLNMDAFVVRRRMRRPPHAPGEWERD